MIRITLFLVCCISIAWQNLSAAEELESDTQWRKDTLLLPQYCKDRAKGINSPEFTRWRATIGDVYVHIHHYCGGIYAEQKAKSSIDPKERKRWLRDVIGQMQYVSNHCSSKCALYPELQTRWGWALAEDGQPAEAIMHFQLAIRAKPAYAPAYAQLSDVYVGINQSDEAQKVLDQGLKAAPRAHMLQRRLHEIETQKQ